MTNILTYTTFITISFIKYNRRIILVYINSFITNTTHPYTSFI